MIFGLASNRHLKPVPNTQLKAGLQGFDLSLEKVAGITVQGAVHPLPVPHEAFKLGNSTAKNRSNLNITCTNADHNHPIKGMGGFPWRSPIQVLCVSTVLAYI